MVWRHPQMVKRIIVIGLALDVLTNEQNGDLCDKLGLNYSYHIRNTYACTLYVGVVGITQTNRSFLECIESACPKIVRIEKLQRGIRARLKIV